MWKLKELVHLVTRIESVCPKAGCHVAITGGLLYKYGKRKDADILFYNDGHHERINLSVLFSELCGIGLEHPKNISKNGRVWRSSFDGKPIDIFFPEFDALNTEKVDTKPVFKSHY